MRRFALGLWQSAVVMVMRTCLAAGAYDIVLNVGMGPLERALKIALWVAVFTPLVEYTQRASDTEKGETPS